MPTSAYELDLAEITADLGSLPDPTTPGGEALSWWLERVKTHTYVGLREELPSPAARQVLRNRELIAETIGRWGFVVRGPHTEREIALRRNMWGLVAAVIRQNQPAAIDRVSAVRLAVGDEAITPEVFVRHAGTHHRRLEIMEGYSIVLRAESTVTHSDSPASSSESADVGGVSTDVTYLTLGAAPPVTLPIVAPAKLLTALTAGDVRDNLETIAVWLRTLVVGRAALYHAYTQDPRPVLVKRMGAIARQVGNERLAQLIGEVVTAHTRSGISRSHTRVGTNLIVPRYVMTQPPAASPWLERHRVRFDQAVETVNAILAPREAVLPQSTIDTVLRIARAAKLEDTYHSTTIEGYRITREEVRAVIEGRPYNGRTPEETERLMALKGYAQAFDWILSNIQTSGGPVEHPQLTEAFILDLFLELWNPSVDAGLVDAPSLRAWRTQPVQIHGSDHVPPAAEKLGSLMTQFVTQLNAAKIGPLTASVLAHWNFVHLHPFKDGNGRTARLLMNYILGAAGLPWTTIRAEERRRYFNALERAHLHNDLAPFATFIAEAVERATPPHSSP